MNANMRVAPYGALLIARDWRKLALASQRYAQRCPTRERIRWGMAVQRQRMRARLSYREAIAAARRKRAAAL